MPFSFKISIIDIFSFNFIIANGILQLCKMPFVIAQLVLLYNITIWKILFVFYCNISYTVNRKNQKAQNGNDRIVLKKQFSI